MSRWPEPTDNPPDNDDLDEWQAEGYALATDGCPVEWDGQCPHGHPSWLLVMGVC